MKILVKQSSGDEKVLMKTSERGGYYTIKFQDDGKYSPYAYLNWGHLNIRQAKMMLKELKWYIDRNDKEENKLSWSDLRQNYNYERDIVILENDIKIKDKIIEEKNNIIELYELKDKNNGKTIAKTYKSLLRIDENYKSKGLVITDKKGETND